MLPVLDRETYAHVQPMLLGYARRAVRREDLAADLVQETWLAGAEHLARYDGRASLRSWLVGILKHKIVDHFRRARRVTALTDTLELAQDPRAEERADAARALRELGPALAALPQQQRRAVELCDLEGWPRERAAEELGVERGHLRVLLHRARAELRDALAASGDPQLH